MACDTIKTAVMLAAGSGSRLRPFTSDRPKCMVEVAGKPILAHTIDALESSGFERLVIVTGYMSEMLREFSSSYPTSMRIEFVHNEKFDSTNNIYSLWLAKKRLPEGFVLIESDIVLQPDVLEKFIRPDRIALDLFDSEIHSGTTSTVCTENYVKRLYLKQNPPPVTEKAYKTVNLYSFSAETAIILFGEIGRLVQKGEINMFYEVAILNLIEKNKIRLEMVSFEEIWWYEIDTPEDLRIADENIGKMAVTDRYKQVMAS